MAGVNFNVDQYRAVHESDTEWRMRRYFILAHHERFPFDRLLGLAGCYVNVKCYGNRYSASIMNQLLELTRDFPEIPVSIVRANEATSSRNMICGESICDAGGHDEVNYLEHHVSTNSYVDFSSYERHEHADSYYSAESIFDYASFDAPNGMETCTMEPANLNTKESQDFTCDSFTDGGDDFVASQNPTDANISQDYDTDSADTDGSAQNDNHEAFGISGDVSGRAISKSSDGMSNISESNAACNQARTSDKKQLLSEFVIIENQTVSGPNSSAVVLRQSAKSNNVQLKINTCDAGTRLSVAGVDLADVVGMNKKESKTAAWTIAMEYMRTICWTVTVKIPVSADGISRDDILRNSWSKPKSINIADPDIGNSQFENIQENFLSRVNAMLREFKQSKWQEPLIFATALSNEDRHTINNEANKYQLQSKTYGGKKTRYIVVSHTRTAKEMFSYVKSSGGETSQYVSLLFRPFY